MRSGIEDRTLSGVTIGIVHQDQTLATWLHAAGIISMAASLAAVAKAAFKNPE